MRTVEFDLEEALHVFSWSIVLHSGVCVLPHHVIDRPHDVQHLLQREGQQGKNVEDVKVVRSCQRYKGHESQNPTVLQEIWIRNVVVLFIH